MADVKPPCGCASVLRHRATCRLVVPPAIAGLPKQLPAGVAVEAHLRWLDENGKRVGRVYLSNFGGIVCLEPDGARATARALLLWADEAERLAADA